MADQSPKPPRSAGRLMVVRGAWALIETLSGSALGIVLSLVLAKMIGPEGYGLAGMALALVIILKVIVTEGFALAIVQRPHISDIHLNSVFWVNITIGAALTAFLLLMAPVLALALGDSRLTAIFRVLSVIPVLSAIAAIPAEKLRREFRFRWLALRPVFGNLLGGCVGVGLAIADFGLWSIVAFQITREAVIAGVVFVGAKWVPRAQFDRATAAGMARFGFQAMGSRLIIMTSARMWVILCGAFLGPTAAGYVRLAEQIFMAVQLVTITPINRVALPTMSRAAQQDRAKVADLYLHLAAASAGLVLPMAGFLAVALPDIIELTYGPSWIPVAHAGQIMMLALVTTALTSHSVTSYFSLNLSGVALKQTIVQFLINLVCYLIATPFGIIAAAAAFAARAYLSLPYVGYMLSRYLHVSIFEACKRIVPPAAASVSLMLVMMLVSWAVPGETETLLLVALEAVAGFLTYFLVLRIIWPTYIEDAFNLAPEQITTRIEAIPALRILFLRRRPTPEGRRARSDRI